MNRRTKQDDSLSSLLFVVIMDKIMKNLKGKTDAFIIIKHKILKPIKIRISVASYEILEPEADYTFAASPSVGNPSPGGGLPQVLGIAVLILSYYGWSTYNLTDIIRLLFNVIIYLIVL